MSFERPSRALRPATAAVYGVFVLSGFAFASWASRIPQVRDALALSPRELGLVLLAIAVGSVISMPLAGVVIGRLGAARTVAVTAVVAAVGLDRKSTRLNSSHANISYAGFCLKKKKQNMY